MIIEDYVSFETAKLLKEKGFLTGDGEVGCRCGFYSETAFQRGHGIITKSGKEVGLVFDDLDNPDLEYDEYLRPTLQMAMKWLREVYGIYPDIAVEEIDDNTTFFRVDGIYLKQKKMWDKYNNLFKTYEEACEEAIKYCLENLI